MRPLRLAAIAALFCCRLPAPLIPGPNLAARIEQADTIAVARLISGTTFASGSEVSNDFVLRVDRVLKGDVKPGSEISVQLKGRGYFVATNPKQEAVMAKLYGIWFLRSTPPSYAVVSRDGAFGELSFAPALLPEGSPGAVPGATPAESVGNELEAALQWVAESYGAQLTPAAQRTGNAQERQAAGMASSQFRTLTEDFRTLAASTTRAAYRRFAAAKPAPLRVFGLQGMIAGNDPEGVKRADTAWSEISAAADLQPLLSSLMSYSNGEDAEAVRALGALALRDPAVPGLRENAVYALRAIHSRETLPALIALLDSREDRVRTYALSGLCLFVRNAPAVTPESVPSMAWLQTRPPTPLLNAETERYCLLGGTLGPPEMEAYASFWKSWWTAHQADR